MKDNIEDFSESAFISKVTKAYEIGLNAKPEYTLARNFISVEAEKAKNPLGTPFFDAKTSKGTPQ